MGEYLYYRDLSPNGSNLTTELYYSGTGNGSLTPEYGTRTIQVPVSPKGVSSNYFTGARVWVEGTVSLPYNEVVNDPGVWRSSGNYKLWEVKINGNTHADNYGTGWGTHTVNTHGVEVDLGDTVTVTLSAPGNHITPGRTGTYKYTVHFTNLILVIKYHINWPSETHITAATQNLFATLYGQTLAQQGKPITRALWQNIGTFVGYTFDATKPLAANYQALIQACANTTHYV